MDLGEKIAALRKAKGLTQAELGEKVAVTFQAVSKWERGESYPDFATVSRLAKVFEVPISYFEAEADESVFDSNRAEEGEHKKMLGVCRTCGKALYDGDAAQTTPVLMCNACAEKERLALKRKAEQAEEQRKEESERQRRLVEEQRQRKRRTLIKGYTRGGICAGVIFLITIISTIFAKAGEKSDTFLGGVVLIIEVFTFVCQFLWGGKIRDIATYGCVVIGTPGVIFTLDLDGLIFLIGVKLLFAVIRFVIMVLTSAVCFFVAVIISPFTFIPKAISMHANM